jgi:hypothetical protein
MLREMSVQRDKISAHLFESVGLFPRDIPSEERRELEEAGAQQKGRSRRCGCTSVLLLESTLTALEQARLIGEAADRNLCQVSRFET